MIGSGTIRPIDIQVHALQGDLRSRTTISYEQKHPRLHSYASDSAYGSRYRPLHNQHASVPELSDHAMSDRAVGAPVHLRHAWKLLATLRGGPAFGCGCLACEFEVSHVLGRLRRCVSALDSNAHAGRPVWLWGRPCFTLTLLMNGIMCETAPSRVRVRRLRSAAV